MNRRSLLAFIFPALILMHCAPAAQVAQIDTTPHDMTEAYNRAESMLGGNLSGKIFNNNVNPNWIDDHFFWYRVNTRRGIEYTLVDMQNQIKGLGFDHERLSHAISQATETTVTAWGMNLQNLEYSSDKSMIMFDIRGSTLQCNLTSYNCSEAGDALQRSFGTVLSPDGTKAAFTQENNLWVRDLASGEETQLTTEGEEYNGFATNSQGWSRSSAPILIWSPDSKKIKTFRQDEREVEKMVLWRTSEGRPQAEIWPYALPGDSIIPLLYRVIVDSETGEKLWLDSPADHQRTSNCCGLGRGQNWGDNEWSPDASKVAFVSTSRDYKEVTLRVANANTGAVRDVFHERDEIFFESNLSSRGVPNWRVLHDSNEFIWFTRKDNWGHLYLHDLESGNLKNQITNGNWNVSDLVHIDEETRTIWFTAVGREAGVNPYYTMLYRINFDGSGLTLLTDDPLNHDVDLSPGLDYIVNTFTDFSTPHQTVVRDRNGNILMILEEADADDLFETGWRAPISFSAKARDGVTDVYGVMILPSNFDPSNKYPIVNYIYPGPQSGSVGTRNFSASRAGQAHALAELGFVVVAIDAFGSPMRSREFHTAYYGNMSDNGLPDQIAAMKQLADRFDYIDINRAGMYGHSGGGFATASAMFQYPEFFKVGVSSAGNHDNRGYTYYWGEKYQGLLEKTDDGDTFTNQANHLQAKNLEGKLLISYGTMDTNVHPSMTLLVVNELIRNNKDFDLMVYPNRGHGYFNEPYNLRITWNYFVRHLLGHEPPADFRIGQ